MSDATTTNHWNPCLNRQESIVFNRLIPVIDRSVLQKLDQYPGPEYYSPGIMAGDAGAILYLFHSALHQNKEELYDKALLHLGQLMEDIGPQHEHSFCSGISGTIWLLLYLQRENIIQPQPDLISEELIEVLCNTSLEHVLAGRYDYMHQGLSVATALLGSEELVVQHKIYFEKIIAALGETATGFENDMIYWEYMLPSKYPGEVSLGMSHGIPSVLSFLSKVNRYKICSDLCESMIEGAAKFLMRHHHAQGVSRYPSMVLPGEEPPYPPTRLGWCYGDMGVAASFLQAAKSVDQPMFREEADNIIAHILNRDDEGQVMDGDATLCHGAWGIAHLFNRLWHFNQHPLAKEKTRYWLHRALELTWYNTKQLAIAKVEDGEAGWNDSPEILNGISGAGLTILSAVAPIRPAWDEIFFLDIN